MRRKAGDAEGPDPIDVYVGGRVRALRVGAGISQAALAAQLGITFQQVQKYESGGNRIGAGRLHRIAALLSVPIGFIFDGAPGPDQSAASPSGSDVVDFLSSAEGLQLNLAFTRIADPRVRRSVTNLVRTIAGNPGGSNGGT